MQIESFSRWPAALRLDERAELLRKDQELFGLSNCQSDKLVRWRNTPAFQSDLTWAHFLQAQNLDESQLSILLNAPSESFDRILASPDWALKVADYSTGSVNSDLLADDREIAGFIHLVAPLVERFAAKLLQSLRGAVGD